MKIKNSDEMAMQLKLQKSYEFKLDKTRQKNN